MADFPFVKIGSSHSAQARLKGLQTSSPFPYKLLAVLSAGAGVEKALHHALSAHRERGEWFRIEGRAKAFIASMQREDFGPDLKRHLLLAKVHWMKPESEPFQRAVLEYLTGNSLI